LREVKYSLLFYPRFDRKTEENIEAFRRKYDPFVDYWKPHIPFVFPVPGNKVKEEEFMQHVRAVLKSWKPFPIRIGGFEKSWDHWLLLLLKEGNGKVIALHDELYTGILAPCLRKDIKFIPHIGIALFVRKDSGYSVLNPKKVAYGAELYAKALKEAEALEIDIFDTVDKLVVNKVILEGTSLYIDRTVLGSKEIRL
jgi:hypothetical protein